MKIIILFAALILLSLNCFSQEKDDLRNLDSIMNQVQQRKTDKEFETWVLDSWTMHSAYLSFNVASKDYTGKVIIENTDLFVFLQNEKGFNKQQYQSFMKDVLLNKKVVEIEKLDKYFIKIKSVIAVEDVAAKGEREFVKHYFSEFGTLKQRLNEDEENAVIAKLFDWKIIAAIDDETGALVIY